MRKPKWRVDSFALALNWTPVDGWKSWVELPPLSLDGPSAIRRVAAL